MITAPHETSPEAAKKTEHQPLTLDEVRYDMLKEDDSVEEIPAPFKEGIASIEPLAIHPSEDPEKPGMALLAVVGLSKGDEGEKVIQVWAPYQHGKIIALGAEQKFTVRLLAEDGAGSDLPIFQGQTLELGRANTDAAQTLGGLGEAISRRHASFGIDEDGTLSIADLGSQGGTKLLKKRKPTRLEESRDTPVEASVLGRLGSIETETLPEMETSKDALETLKRAYEYIAESAPRSTRENPISMAELSKNAHSELGLAGQIDAKVLLELMIAGADSNPAETDYALRSIENNTRLSLEEQGKLSTIIDTIAREGESRRQYGSSEQDIAYARSNMISSFLSELTANLAPNEARKKDAMKAHLLAYGAGVVAANEHNGRTFFNDLVKLLETTQSNEGS